MKYQRYKWQYVISKVNTDNLEKIASSLNTDLFELNKVWDLNKINSKLEKLEKKAITKKWINSLNSYSRNLTIFSLILFIIFLWFYMFENKKIKSPK